MALLRHRMRRGRHDERRPFSFVMTIPPVQGTMKYENLGIVAEAAPMPPVAGRGSPARW
jgi:hypothetical protein